VRFFRSRASVNVSKILDAEKYDEIPTLII